MNKEEENKRDEVLLTSWQLFPAIRHSLTIICRAPSNGLRWKSDVYVKDISTKVSRDKSGPL